MKPIALNQENFDTTFNSATTPILVDFWAEWCGPCKMLAPVLDEIAVEQPGQALIAKINVDESPGLASRFNITSIPTLLYFTGGKEHDRSVGAASKRSILTKLTALKAHSATTQTA